ncbi:hypothetical protein L1857_26065 [Amycolatopsis thermalba]|uniref:MarR family transcriptional regulator n=1 Tax=Amycolatopsis thermalba TaxID=944492 RepID=A0ABY4P109_9PSEU|nr:MULTISPECIES: hypothetical protein [Amycolatopsis]UQS26029.1 hypothetical protein L1857_26065 [Amycolatopsis thermalba]
MSRKNPLTSDTAERHLHVAAHGPDQQPAATTTDGKVRAALADNPSLTTAELALVAGIGRSTAGKILARWDRDGVVIRTPGVGPRDPDKWSLAPSDIAIAPDVEQPVTPETAPSTDSETDSTDDAGDPAEAADAPHDAATPAANDSTPGDDAPAALPEPPSACPADSTHPAEPLAEVSTTDAETADTAPTAEKRLPKGGLRALVAEYLTEHAGQSFGPAKIGKDLGRSGGAVNNALEKLTADGYAIKTCEAPKRFAINPTKTDVPQEARDTA